jgi:hypothetical protein
MARLSVSRPRGIGARGHCAPSPTDSPCVASVPAATGSLRSIAIDSSTHAVRVRSSLRAPATAPLLGVAMNPGYRQAFETTNEFVRIKF